jgi:hypothetical protein
MKRFAGLAAVSASQIVVTFLACFDRMAGAVACAG